MSDTIPSVFRTVAGTFKDHVLFNYFRDTWKSMTYGEFFALSERIAAYLRSLDFNKGDRAAIVSENRPEWCAAYMATVMCGGIAVPIDMQLGAGEIGTLLADSGARVVFCSSKTEANVSDGIGVDAISSVNLDADDLFRPEGASGITHYASRENSPEDIASIIYTSGTTGNPKGVMLTHDNFCSDARAVIEGRVVAREDNVLSVLPLHHTYPFMCTFIVPLFLGATVTFSPGLKAADLVSAIKENGVTVVVGVPRLFETIRNGIVSKIKEKGPIGAVLLWMLRISGVIRRKLDINAGKRLFRAVHLNFAKVKFFASGGARLDPSVMEDLEALGFTVVEGYGLTETSPVITFNPVHKRKPGSAGRPLPGVSIRTDDRGEIIVRGPMVMKGYYKNPGATGEILRDGELLTGDIGYLDDEGYLFITGRRKEVIVLSSGKNIYPEDVEKAYMITPLIKEICVIGIERGGSVDAVQAVIVPDFEYAKRESIGNVTELLGWKISEASANLPAYMRLKGYTLYPDPLPRTPLGKLRRFMVKDLVKRQEQKGKSRQQVNNTLIGDDVGRTVAEAIRALIDEDTAVHASDNLELELGFDSLKKIELISSLENAFGIGLPETFITEVQTVGDIVAALKAHTGEAPGEMSPGAGGAVSWKEIFEKEPSAGDTDKIGYGHGIVELTVICVIFIALKVWCKLFFRLRAEGIEQAPGEGPFVITPNHASYLDGFVMAAAVPFTMFRKLYFLGLQQFFTGRVKSRLARMSHVIPIDSEVYLHMALQMSAYVLKSRKVLCIFPEGGRSFDGAVMPFKKGIGVLALELGIPVVPAYIDGTFRALPRGAFFPRPVPVRVIFGKPVAPSGTAAKHPADAYQSFADRLRDEVIRLSSEQMAKS